MEAQTNSITIKNLSILTGIGNVSGSQVSEVFSTKTATTLQQWWFSLKLTKTLIIRCLQMYGSRGKFLSALTVSARLSWDLRPRILHRVHQEEDNTAFSHFLALQSNNSSWSFKTYQYSLLEWFTTPKGNTIKRYQRILIFFDICFCHHIYIYI